MAYILLLLGHVLGNFYLQSGEVAEKKAEKLEYLIYHSIIYMICMAVVLYIGILPSRDMVYLWMFVSAAHFCIDLFKKHIPVKPFIIDQLLHLLSFWVALRVWGAGVQVNSVIEQCSDWFPSKPLVTVVLGLLCILRPVGILIGKGEIWDFNKSGDSAIEPPPENAPDRPERVRIKPQEGAGKMIGYLERIIVYFLLLNGQYTAIAFVIAAKSVARFPEINEGDKRSLAEYYLIGTLLSMVSVFTVTILLGLVAP